MLIRQMAAENSTWGEERIANELKLKLGIRVSPRTVGKYLAQGPRRIPDPSQRWLAFVRNHAQAIVACDFLVVVTARFRILYVFVLMELGLATNPARQRHRSPQRGVDPTAIARSSPGDHPFRFLIHDRDSIFSQQLDQGVAAMGVRVLRTPASAPSKCGLRTSGRDDPPGVPGFPDTTGTAASQAYSQWMGTPLQSRPCSHELGTGYPGAASSLAGANRTSTRASPRPSSVPPGGAGWTTSRILVG